LLKYSLGCRQGRRSISDPLKSSLVLKSSISCTLGRKSERTKPLSIWGSIPQRIPKIDMERAPDEDRLSPQKDYFSYLNEMLTLAR
jgi:hypothetical protein